MNDIITLHIVERNFQNCNRFETKKCLAICFEFYGVVFTGGIMCVTIVMLRISYVGAGMLFSILNEQIRSTNIFKLVNRRFSSGVEGRGEGT